MDKSGERIRHRVISLYLDDISYEAAITAIVNRARKHLPGYVCFANVHMTIEAYDDAAFAADVNNALMVLADGVPLLQALRLLYRRKQERVAGMDVMPSLLSEAERYKMKVFFFGTTTDMLEKIQCRAKIDYPNLEIVGLLSPPFNQPFDNEAYVRDINASGAHLVFVALGCPKQETWMARQSTNIHAVLLGVGGAFPVYAGLQKRAPRFMHRVGMEWLYRLAQEPRRLFKRYTRTNTKFLSLLMRDLISPRRI